MVLLDLGYALLIAMAFAQRLGDPLDTNEAGACHHFFSRAASAASLQSGLTIVSIETILVSVETIRERYMSEPLTSSGLEAHLGYSLRRVSNHVSGTFARTLQTRHVSVAEWVVLRLIQEQESLTSGQLADALGMTRGAISKVVEKLKAKDWISRKVDPQDNRIQWLSLARQGRGLLPRLAEIADKNDGQCFGCLDDNEQATLRLLLQKLTDFHSLRKVPVD